MTIPPETLRRADQLARRWDRSRSWVIAEGIRRLPPDVGGGVGMVAEPAGVAGAPLSTVPALDPFRRQQLEADLALTPEERVLAAERTAREAPNRSFPSLVVSFSRPEDYHAWKTMEAAGLL